MEAAQPGAALRAAVTASRRSLREPWQTLARRVPEVLRAGRTRPLSERGNLPPMKSLQVLRTGRRDGDFMRRAVRGDGTQGAGGGK